MESRDRRSEDFASSNIEKSFQQSCEVSEPSVKQTTKEDTITNNDDKHESASHKENFKADINEDLSKINEESEPLNKEITSDSPANPSLDSEGSPHSKNVHTTAFANLFKGSLHKYKPVFTTGGEILLPTRNAPKPLKHPLSDEIPNDSKIHVSTRNAPGPLEYPPSDEISQDSEIHVCDTDHNYADTKFQNISENTVCERWTFNKDHCYASSPASDDLEDIPEQFRIEEVD